MKIKFSEQSQFVQDTLLASLPSNFFTYTPDDKPLTEIELTLSLNGKELNPLDFIKLIESHWDNICAKQAVSILREQFQEAQDKIAKLQDSLDGVESSLQVIILNKTK